MSPESIIVWTTALNKTFFAEQKHIHRVIFHYIVAPEIISDGPTNQNKPFMSQKETDGMVYRKHYYL